MTDIVEYVANTILENIKKEESDEFDEALRNERENLIEFYAPQLDEVVMNYAITEQKNVPLNAEDGDASAYHTLARKALDHLATFREQERVAATD